MTEYFDKHGRKIEPGMSLRHDDGEIWEVSPTVSSATGESDLGMSCNRWEAYPLWQFNLGEWEVVE